MLDAANYNSAVDQPIIDPIGQVIQRTFPQLRLVKALNSVSAHLMADPASKGAPHHVFVASDHADAKQIVVGILQAMGWASIIDLGDLGACRPWNSSSRSGCG